MQFTTKLKTSVEMEALLARAREHVMTEEEWREQRISFTYGNLPVESKTTKDDVRRAAASIRLSKGDGA